MRSFLLFNAEGAEGCGIGFRVAGVAWFPGCGGMTVGALALARRWLGWRRGGDVVSPPVIPAEAGNHVPPVANSHPNLHPPTPPPVIPAKAGNHVPPVANSHPNLHPPTPGFRRNDGGWGGGMEVGVAVGDGGDVVSGFRRNDGGWGGGMEVGVAVGDGGDVVSGFRRNDGGSGGGMEVGVAVGDGATWFPAFAGMGVGWECLRGDALGDGGCGGTFVTSGCLLASAWRF